ncbi:glycosyltransferase [Candidatus Saccharibacteria bacterium]|nr:glycosyltransferase [Candidatus Saccharibacteria bacterium]
MPKVSIILSSYNHAQYISKSIQSILKQTFSDFELYIIDDCSDDDSWKIIKSFKDSRIISVRNKKNLGIVIRPEIINRLKGEYIAMAHCDDEWALDKLEKQVAFLDKNSDYDACFTLVKLIDDDGNRFVDKQHQYYSIFEQKNRSRLEWLQHFFYNGNAVCHPSVLLRMSAQKKYSLYAAGMAALPDAYRWIKLCLHSNIYIYPERLTYFRVRNKDENTSGDKLENKIRYNFESFMLLDSFLDILDYSKEDFLAVFPTSKKYFVNKDDDMGYIFARTLIDRDFHPYQLYGMSFLWRIMQDLKRRKKIEEKYNFTNKNFVELSGSIDVFDFLSSQKTMVSTVYYDIGSGFNQKKSISQRVYINNRGNFRARFDLSNIRNKINLRFDPFENLFAKLKDVVIFVDGKKVEYEMSNYKMEDDGYVEFEDGDPQFLIKNCSGNILTVMGNIRLANYEEMSQLVKTLKSQAEETCWQRLKRQIRAWYNE